MRYVQFTAKINEQHFVDITPGAAEPCWEFKGKQRAAALARKRSLQTNRELSTAPEDVRAHV